MTPVSFTNVALVGNPNCGKTALFNALTGSRQKVANYPGVTVERKEGLLTTPEGRRVRVVDLPGTYSLRARSPDEEITRDAVLGKMSDEPAPQFILCVADASNLRLGLRLALELRKLNIPMALVLNMIDIAQKRGSKIDLERLSKELQMPVVPSVAVRRGGTAELLAHLDSELGKVGTKAPEPLNWIAPDRAAMSELQNEADRIIGVAVAPPEMPHTFTGRLDNVLLHPVWGLLILLAVLFLMFQAVFTWAQPPMEAIKAAFDTFGIVVDRTLPEGLVRSFIHNGLISGVGAVVVFLPQILILFFFILLLEDFGYMARAAFLMDKIMGSAGLHGRAFIPLLSSFACAVPAIMATRVIDNRRDRLTTILIAPFMTCSARIPVYTLLIAAFIPAKPVFGGVQLQGLVMFSLYALGITSAMLMSFIFRRILWRDVPPEPFILELPDYKKPQMRNIVLGVWQRGAVFLKRAGTTIAAMMMVVWFLASFPRPPANAVGPAINYSLAAQIGKGLEPVFAPIGFPWQINMALVPGMAAREVAVAALGTVYSIEEGQEAALAQTLAEQWSLATALALLAWYVFAPQCVSTLITIRRETGSVKWMLFSFGSMMTMAYIAAFVTFHVASALGG